MVTASHNDNGWTGVKMGAERPVTFGPDEMAALARHRARRAISTSPGGGSYAFVEDFPDRYVADLTDRPEAAAASSRSWRPAATARRAPSRRAILEALGCEVDPARRGARPHLPALQPEPRGHGDAPCHGGGREGARRRCRRSASTATATAAAWSTRTATRSSPTRSAPCWRATCRALHPDATFVVDVKSTGLFADRSRAASERGAKTDYWKTGHSYIKRRVQGPERARRASRSPATSSSTRRSGAATTTGS